MIEERLDRAMVNTKWMEMYPNVTLLNNIASHPDHNLIVLNCDPIQR